MPDRKVLKFAHEIERGDILVIEDKEAVVISRNLLPETKSVHLELQLDKDDPFSIVSVHFDTNDPFIILKTI